MKRMMVAVSASSVFSAVLAGCVASPMVKAAGRGETWMIEHYLKSGHSPNAASSQFLRACKGRSALDYYPVTTPLENAAASGHVDSIKLLIERGARVEGVGPEHGTPLMAAAACGQSAAVRLLLDEGADPSAEAHRRYFDRATPLYFAAMLGRDGAARLLLDAGADPTGSYSWQGRNGIGAVTTKTGALSDLAADKGHEALAGLLRDAEKAGAPKRGRRAAKTSAVAQAVEALEKAADDARTAGKAQDALIGYADALRDASSGSDADSRIRRKAIEVARSMRSEPPLPESAETLVLRARAFLKKADNPDGYRKAAEELDKASRLAPWSASVYYNLGLVREKTEDYDAAIRSLELYLLASPGADDAKTVKAKIIELGVSRELDGGKRPARQDDGDPSDTEREEPAPRPIRRR